MTGIGGRHRNPSPSRQKAIALASPLRFWESPGHEVLEVFSVGAVRRVAGVHASRMQSGHCHHASGCGRGLAARLLGRERHGLRRWPRARLRGLAGRRGQLWRVRARVRWGRGVRWRSMLRQHRLRGGLPCGRVRGGAPHGPLGVCRRIALRPRRGWLR
uniref:Uncharacterized protein n=1 Tax=uncultured bacterium A1Q1_fos_479 TaxID=1256575 RepID=L7VX94_9BACT|nr:hypothetical protein [uncultured bacterium A1Q1_fos_479]